MKQKTKYNYAYLRGYLLENKIKEKDFAELLGITTQSVRNKYNGKSYFTNAEIDIVKKHFNLSDKLVDFFFFNKQNVCKREQDE